jgi:hypothetical protein
VTFVENRAPPRQFTESDIAGSSNVIATSASTARAVFGSLDPIGRDIAFDDALGRERAMVVAVVRDTRTTRLSDGLLRQTFSPRTVVAADGGNGSTPRCGHGSTFKRYGPPFVRSIRRYRRTSHGWRIM